MTKNAKMHNTVYINTAHIIIIFIIFSLIMIARNSVVVQVLGNSND